MAFVYDWISKIVLFMLIGTIIEMLLPSNSMKKYVHFVFGILFLLLLAQPIFYLFQTDITEQITRIEKELHINDGKLDQTKLNIEKQKKDIQAEQAAYIWNELAEHYKNLANPMLEKEYRVHIATIDFMSADNMNPVALNFSNLIVSLVEYSENTNSIVTTITPVKITGQKSEDSQQTEEKDTLIERSLRQMWQLEDDIRIELQWEGGTM